MFAFQWRIEYMPELIEPFLQVYDHGIIWLLEIKIIIRIIFIWEFNCMLLIKREAFNCKNVQWLYIINNNDIQSYSASKQESLKHYVISDHCKVNVLHADKIKKIYNSDQQLLPLWS